MERAYLFLDTLQQHTPPPPAPVPHRQSLNDTKAISPQKQEADIHSALKDIRTTLQKSKINNDISPTHHFSNGADYRDNISVLDKPDSPTASLSPVWIPR